ncbi:MAG: amidohydrolase [Actinomycetota bacterium]
MSDRPESVEGIGPATSRLVADHVLTGVSGPHGPDTAPVVDFVAGGAIDIADDGRIVAVGNEADLGPAPASVTRFSGLLMPGLVNAHAHTPMTLVRSAGDGMPLQQWLTDAVWPREGRMTPDDAWWGMTLGSAEMLLAGVTTSNEMYFFEEQIADAVSRSGARLMMTPGVIQALLPDGQVGARIAEIADFHRRFHDPDNRINVGFAPHSLYDLTPEQCGEIADMAKRSHALFHIHLEETTAERDLVRERYGKSATQALADAGCLEAKVVAAHGVWLDDDDQRLLADAGASVAHCPQSNLKLGSGIAPIAKMLAAGLAVALGTDGVASNDDLDLWEELKLAPLLARGSTTNPQAMPAATAIHLATAAGGAALGLDDVGHLSVGARADIIRIDTDQPAFTPGLDLPTHLVFGGSSRFVTDVWVDGHRVVADGTLTTLDLDEAKREVTTRGRRIAEAVA